jgi:hypothetical protein
VKNPDERQAVPIRGWLTVKAVINSLMLLPGFQNHAVTGTACEVIASKLDERAVEGGHVYMLPAHVNGTADLFDGLIQNCAAGIQVNQTQFAVSAPPHIEGPSSIKLLESSLFSVYLSLQS